MNQLLQSLNSVHTLPAVRVEHKYSPVQTPNMSVCLSACLPVYLPVCLCMSACLSVCLYVCLYVCLSVLSVCLCLSLCLSVCLSLCLSVFLSCFTQSSYSSTATVFRSFGVYGRGLPTILRRTDRTHHRRPLARPLIVRSPGNLLAALGRLRRSPAAARSLGRSRRRS